MVVKEKDKILQSIFDFLSKEKSVVFIRHHNDGDGYSAGINAEIVLSKIAHINRKPIGFFSYNYSFMLRDIKEINKLKTTYNYKNVLFILMDISLSKETLLTLKTLKLKTKAKILVIDHHLIEDKNLFEEVVDFSYINLNKNSGYLSYELFFTIVKKYNIKLENDELAFMGFLRYMSTESDFYYHLRDYLRSKLKEEIIKKNEELYLLFEKIFSEGRNLNKSLEELFFVFKNYEMFKEDIKYLKEKLEYKIKKANSLIKKEDVFDILDLDKLENFKEFPNPKIYLNLLVKKNRVLIAYSDRIIILRNLISSLNLRKLLIEMKRKGIIGGAHQSRASFEVPKKNLENLLREIKDFIKKELDKERKEESNKI